LYNAAVEIATERYAADLGGYLFKKRLARTGSGKCAGHKLVEMLIKIARERGLEDVRADVLRENEKMLSIFRRLGFATQCVAGGTSEVLLTLK